MIQLIRGILPLSALFLGLSAFSGSEPSQEEDSSFFDFFISKESPAGPSKQPAYKKSARDEEALEEDFSPSLSETLSDTARLKNKMKRQLARERRPEPRRFPAKQNTQRGPSQSASGEMARFGDFEIGISERTEEDLTSAKKQK